MNRQCRFNMKSLAMSSNPLNSGPTSPLRRWLKGSMLRPATYTALRTRASYDVLHKLIRELSIDPNLIFFPEKPVKDAEMEELVRNLYRCDKRSMAIIKATVKAALESQPE